MEHKQITGVQSQNAGVERMFDEMTERAIKAAAESSEPFPVDLDRAWKWVGHSSKGNGKRVLESYFKEGTDFFSELRKSNGGRPSEEIWLSKHCFKEFCMIANTAKGKVVRGYCGLAGRPE